MILSYLGSKRTLLPCIKKVMEPLISQHGGKDKCVLGDLFSGTSIVGHTFRDSVKTVIASDMELYAYVLGKALLQTVFTPKLAKVIDRLNSSAVKPVKGLVWRNFTPSKPPMRQRKFFTCYNGMKIDAIRIEISNMYAQKTINYKEFVFLLASLLASASRHSNTSGTFRAYLKQFCKRSLKRFTISPVHRKRSVVGKHHMIKNDATRVACDHAFDIAYLDPPYNTAHYGAYYSFFNYLCMYSSSLQLTGVGILKHYNRSQFGYAKKAPQAFTDLFPILKAKHIVLSYNANAAIPCKEMVGMLLKKGDVTLYKIWYKNYRPNNMTKHNHVKEFLFVVDCHTNSTSTQKHIFKEQWLTLDQSLG